MFRVQKRDGVPEDFEKGKVLNGVTKSGGSMEEAEKVLAEIEAWLPSVAVNGVVKSTDIREKLLEILREVNSVAAANFEAYKKQAQV